MSRIAFKDKAFTLDGVPRFMFAGEISQIRLPASEWRDRLEKMASLGLNCIGVYDAWNLHSPEKGVYDFESPDKDFGAFLDEAQRVGLHVMVRPGPYICNEWDLGGFPGWLLKEDPRDWRTSSPEHLKHSLEWYHRINQIIAPRQIDKGGPVILYQVENEHFWGDKGLYDGLAQAARNDGITVPLISNGGGSVNRSGSQGVLDGCDIYTDVYERWRWRGWMEQMTKLAGDAPLMVVEYNAGRFEQWGAKVDAEALMPSPWMTALTRMFLGLGANLLNPFVIAGGITPIDLGSDHCCTAYFEDAAISHWGGLGRKFYLLRPLAEAVSSVNGALAESRPNRDFWASDNGYVEGMLRTGKKGSFVVAVNHSTHPERFHVKLPDGRLLGGAGTFAIGPMDTQLHLIDVDCGGGITLQYSTAQVMKIWSDGGALNVVVHGEDGLEGHAAFVAGGQRIVSEYVCRDEVAVRRISAGGKRINLYAISSRTAERTWFVKTGQTTVALFGNLDLVRPQMGGDQLNAEIARGTAPLVITDAVRLSANGGISFSVTKRQDGLIENRGSVPDSGNVTVHVGQPTYKAEDYSWISRLPQAGNGWSRVETCSPAREVITRVGSYQYAAGFECGPDLPQYLEFLGISSAETVVYLNGKKLAAFPEKRRATFHEMGDYRLRIPVAGIIRPGSNVLALTMTVTGRHNMGNPLYAGLSHPIVLYNERKEIALARWELADFGGRRYPARELDAASEALLKEISSRQWRPIDLSDPPLLREGAASDWLDIRCVRREIEIPREMKGRPIFLEFGKIDDAWCYVNGKPAGRAYHQMSATFDLSEFSAEKSVQVLLAGRYYWHSKCIPSIVPRLVTADVQLSGTFLRREGTDGDRGKYFASTGAFQTTVHPADAQALWMQRNVTVEIPDRVIAPMYVELDEAWRANAVIYWNGKAIGRYSIVGPDRRFFVPSGILKRQNTLTVYVDGYGSTAAAGGVKVAPFAEQIAMSLNVTPETK